MTVLALSLTVLVLSALCFYAGHALARSAARLAALDSENAHLLMALQQHEDTIHALRDEADVLRLKLAQVRGEREVGMPT